MSSMSLSRPSFDSLGVGDVELGDVGEDVSVFGAGGHDAHFVAELAVGSRDEYVHSA